MILPQRMSCSRLLWKERAVRHAAWLSIVGAVLAHSTAAHADNVLSVLSYNVHGLPALIAQDHPRSRVKLISTLANKYDVVLFQENFEYQRIIRARMDDRIGFSGNGMRFDPRRWLAKVLLAPVALIVPNFSAPYGAGLSAFVKSALMLPGDVDRASYGVCDGWLGARLDCWASKGYLRVGVHTDNGALVDVYTTHLDAGRSKRSLKVRRHQLRKLAREIERQPPDRGIIVGGDLNLRADRPADLDVLMEFRQRLHLHDSGAGPEWPLWRSRDYILYRSGTQAQISVEDSGEALEFVNGDRALSDHPAIFADFRIAPLAADSAVP